VPVYPVDPLSDPRWDPFTQGHPCASVFHTSGWLRALQRCYGYQPIAFTVSSPQSQLTNALVFAKVDSWLTGCRLVSLPFSDHCEPLVDGEADALEILRHASRDATKNGCRFAEIRPSRPDFSLLGSRSGFGVSETYVFHRVNLQSSEDDLFHRFHKDCVQRRIRRAERERLEYREGNSEDLLRMFYDLLVKTRRKHQLPPPPISWFSNLIECLGRKLQIRVVLTHDTPVASIVTLAWKDTLVYKYGCSDPRFNNLGGTALVLWRAIQSAKAVGMKWLDLGRSDIDNPGLVAFKDHWGGSRTSITYWRYPAPAERAANSNWKKRAVGQLFKRMPDSLLVLTGRLLYRHMG
jgi:hypothetical protein